MRVSDEERIETTLPVPDRQDQEKAEPDAYVGRHRRVAWRSAAVAALAIVATVMSAAAAGSPAQAAVAGCTRSASFQAGQATVFAPADNSYSWRCTMRRGTGSWSNSTSWHWGVFQLQQSCARLVNDRQHADQLISCPGVQFRMVSPFYSSGASSV